MITEIARSGITIVLVEQNARMVLKLSQYGYVLETGRLALEGPASDPLASPWIKGIYFGGGERGQTWRCLTLTQKITALDCSPSPWIHCRNINGG
jgi:hypothetical protein